MTHPDKTLACNEDRVGLADMKSERCPRCDSPDPARHPAMQFEGEVQICSHPWHGALTPEPTPNPECGPVDLRGALEALKFYASEWQANGAGDSETPGLSRSWMEPTDELHKDEGRKARHALASLPPASGRDLA